MINDVYKWEKGKKGNENLVGSNINFMRNAMKNVTNIEKIYCSF